MPSHLLQTCVCLIRVCARRVQSVRVYATDGTEVARTDAACSRGDRLMNVRLEEGKTYAFVLDGRHGEPYGSWYVSYP